MAGLEAPIDTVLLDVRDGDRFGASAARARAHGFQGKLCLHPDQVPLANSAFAPSPEDVERAAAVVQAFAIAEQSGSASITVAGQFVDYPVVRQAERVLGIARRLGMYR
jgi:citrate lyase subunit beta/citryl-CoA lyase